MVLHKTLIHNIIHVHGPQNELILRENESKLRFLEDPSLRRQDGSSRVEEGLGQSGHGRFF